MGEFAFDVFVARFVLVFVLAVNGEGVVVSLDDEFLRFVLVNVEINLELVSLVLYLQAHTQVL